MGEFQKVRGLKELEKTLSQLPKATQKNVLNRVLKIAGKPMVDAMKQAAPKDSGKLGESFLQTTRRPKGETTGSQKLFAQAKSVGFSTSTARDISRAAGSGPVIQYIGPGPNPQGSLQEFGTKNHPPQPTVRPEWDKGRQAILTSITSQLRTEISKSAARYARKLARR